MKAVASRPASSPETQTAAGGKPEALEYVPVYLKVGKSKAPLVTCVTFQQRPPFTASDAYRTVIPKTTPSCWAQSESAASGPVSASPAALAQWQFAQIAERNQRMMMDGWVAARLSRLFLIVFVLSPAKATNSMTIKKQQ